MSNQRRDDVEQQLLWTITETSEYGTVPFVDTSDLDLLEQESLEDAAAAFDKSVNVYGDTDSTAETAVNDLGDGTLLD